MIYLQADKDVVIKYDEDLKTAEVVSKSALSDQIDQLSKDLPDDPSDEVLLAWAKENYPGLKELQSQRDRLDALKEETAQIGSVQVTGIKEIVK
jgi:hypothetical protein